MAEDKYGLTTGAPSGTPYDPNQERYSANIGPGGEDRGWNYVPGESEQQRQSREDYYRRANAYYYGGSKEGAGEAAGRYRSMADYYTQMQAPQTNWDAANIEGAKRGAIEQQQAEALALQREAAYGRVPSAAQLQMQAGLDETLRNQASAAAGARGPQAQAMAQYQAAATGSLASTQIAQQQAALRAQEMAQARGAYGQMGLGMGQEALAAEQLGMRRGEFETETEMSQRKLGLAGGLGYSGLESDVRKAQLEATMAEQGREKAWQEGEAQRALAREQQGKKTEMAVGGGIMSALGGMLGGLSDVGAKQNVRPIGTYGGTEIQRQNPYGEEVGRAYEINRTDPYARVPTRSVGGGSQVPLIAEPQPMAAKKGAASPSLARVMGKATNAIGAQMTAAAAEPTVLVGAAQPPVATRLASYASVPYAAQYVQPYQPSYSDKLAKEEAYRIKDRAYTEGFSAARQFYAPAPARVAPALGAWDTMATTPSYSDERAKTAAYTQGVSDATESQPGPLARALMRDASSSRPAAEGPSAGFHHSNVQMAYGLPPASQELRAQALMREATSGRPGTEGPSASLSRVLGKRKVEKADSALLRAKNAATWHAP